MLTPKTLDFLLANIFFVISIIIAVMMGFELHAARQSGNYSDLGPHTILYAAAILVLLSMCIHFFKHQDELELRADSPRLLYIARKKYD